MTKQIQQLVIEVEVESCGNAPKNPLIYFVPGQPLGICSPPVHSATPYGKIISIKHVVNLSGHATRVKPKKEQKP